MLNFFGRRKPIAGIKEASAKMADALQDEGLFGAGTRKSFAEKREDFVKQVIHSTKKERDIEFSFPNGSKLVIDTRKKGNRFVFSEVTFHSTAAGSDDLSINHRLNEIAMENSSI